MRALLLRKHGTLDDFEVVNDYPTPMPNSRRSA
jgi:hypothetical protein